MRYRRWDLIAASVALAGMIATPLSRRGGRLRRLWSSVVVLSWFTTTAARTTARWGAPRAVAAAATITASTAAIERIGVRTGLVFGRYHYTSALQPQIVGVPVIVPLAWFAMAVPARETATAALAGRRPVRLARLARIVLGAAALTAWDTFLDPQMVGEGYWSWERHGRYRQIPMSNFLGWFVTGLGVMTALEVLLPPNASETESNAADPVLVGEYATMAVMETVGFAAFFRDRLVAVVGGVAMVPIAAIALGRLWRARTPETGGR